METLRILWYNWRCIKHPLAGGAEVYTHETARRLARQGHEIILVTSNPGNLPSREEIEGYQVIRAGGKYTVYLKARGTYRKLRRQGWKPDTVIDEVNTIPFQTPKYAEEPVIMLIHQLCKDCWSHAIHPLIQPIGWWLEKTLHKTYIEHAQNGRIKTIVTVSNSTRQDLIDLGYPPGKITIIPNGLDWEHYKDCPQKTQSKEDLAVYIGRITPYKKIEDILKAWRQVEQEKPKAHLVIAGRPDLKYVKKLRKLEETLNLKNTEVRVNISQQEKKTLLAKAKTLIYTSTREGWGQTVLEAAACKTPTIAYNIPGLRDAVQHMKTGILVQPGNTRELAEKTIEILENAKLRNTLAENAYQNAKQYTWEKTTQTFQRTIKASTHG